MLLIFLFESLPAWRFVGRQRAIADDITQHHDEDDDFGLLLNADHHNVPLPELIDILNEVWCRPVASMWCEYDA